MLNIKHLQASHSQIYKNINFIVATLKVKYLWVSYLQIYKNLNFILAMSNIEQNTSKDARNVKHKRCTVWVQTIVKMLQNDAWKRRWHKMRSVSLGFIHVGQVVSNPSGFYKWANQVSDLPVHMSTLFICWHTCCHIANTLPRGVEIMWIIFLLPTQLQGCTHTMIATSIHPVNSSAVVVLAELSSFEQWQCTWLTLLVQVYCRRVLACLLYFGFSHFLFDTVWIARTVFLGSLHVKALDRYCGVSVNTSKSASKYNDFDHIEEILGHWCLSKSPFMLFGETVTQSKFWSPEG